MNVISRYIAAVLVCFTLASVAHSQFVLLRLTELSVEVSWLERLTMTAEDWWGLLPTFGAVIAVGLLIALLVASALQRFWFKNGTMLYPFAGAAALLVIHAAMQPIMDITLIAGARSMAGLAAQMGAGLAGGWCFAVLKPARRLFYT